MEVVEQDEHSPLRSHDHDHDHHSNNSVLRIQTSNLPGQPLPHPTDNGSVTAPAPLDTATVTPNRVPSARSITSLTNDSYSSPILTPSGSTLIVPSRALTPLPSPLVLGAATFPSSLSFDNLVLGPSFRRNKYSGSGAGVPGGDKRGTSELSPSNGVERRERSVSSNLSGRTLTSDGLRREEVHASSSRTSSVGDEVFDLEYWRTPEDKWIRYPSRYIKVKSLGRGTFSNVVLAEPFDPISSEDTSRTGSLPEQVAIKVVHLEAHDDAPAERITSSARRELDILKRISHLSITRLLAYKEFPEKCLFGLPFSAGGDLFDFASRHRRLLTPILVKRIFRELALAVQYLHEEMHVVHRDLKLENILLNYPASELEKPSDCPTPLISLTDLGLSRPYDPQSPLLSTRCGSTDYAAPEIILGQPYDGRATDAWALGVILYCLLECRLPFDPPQDARRPGKVAHRIAMGQWKWYKLARERRTKSVTEIDLPVGGAPKGAKGVMGGGVGGAKDVTVVPGGSVSRTDGGEGAFLRGGGVWEGGMEIVEGLLRRKPEVRLSIKEVFKSSWLEI